MRRVKTGKPAGKAGFFIARKTNKNMSGGEEEALFLL